MSRKKKILVVDDELDIRVYLGALLEDAGYEVIVADDGLQAMEKAVSEKPDLVTLDISMPEQSGVRTYRQLKTQEDLKDIPVVIITGFSDKMSIYLQKLSGFPFPEGFINKPVEPESFRLMIQDLVK